MIDSILLYLSDFLMFTPQIWARLVTRYQQDIWPLQPFVICLGCYLLWRVVYHGENENSKKDRIINAGLSIGWFWVGVVFHLNYYSTISWAALGFGGLFILQALLLLCFGVIFNQLQYQNKAQFNISNKIGMVVIIFALMVLPLLTASQANDWTQANLFGISPDATSIATIGFILCAKPAARGFWLVLPVLWCLISIAERLAIIQ